MNQRPYVLGHSDHELGRLGRQAELVDSFTREYLVTAGVKPGMRVLDVGSGAGDVAFLAAALTAPGGHVVGTDTATAAVSAATAAASARGLSETVRFLAGDPAELSFDRPFDAIIGRYVLVSAGSSSDAPSAFPASGARRDRCLSRAGLACRPFVAAGADLRPMLSMGRRDDRPGRQFLEHG